MVHYGEYEIDDSDAICEAEEDEKGTQKIKNNVKDFESKSVRLIRTLTYLLLDFTCLRPKDKIRVYGFGEGSFDTDHLDIKDFLPWSPYALYLAMLKEQYVWRASIDTTGAGDYPAGISLPPVLSYEDFHRPVHKWKRRRSHGPGVVDTAAVQPASGSSTPTTVVMASEPEVVEGAMSNKMSGCLRGGAGFITFLYLVFRTSLFGIRFSLLSFGSLRFDVFVLVCFVVAWVLQVLYCLCVYAIYMLGSGDG